VHVEIFCVTLPTVDGTDQVQQKIWEFWEISKQMAEFI